MRTTHPLQPGSVNWFDKFCKRATIKIQKGVAKTAGLRLLVAYSSLYPWSDERLLFCLRLFIMSLIYASHTTHKTSTAVSLYQPSA